MCVSLYVFAPIYLYRLSPRATAEWCGFTDSAVQLLTSLCWTLFPDVQSPQTANQQSRCLWPGLTACRGGGRTWGWGAGERKRATDSLQTPYGRTIMTLNTQFTLQIRKHGVLMCVVQQHMCVSGLCDGSAADAGVSGSESSRMSEKQWPHGSSDQVDLCSLWVNNLSSARLYVD